MPTIEAHLTYEVDSPGEVEDIVQRLRATSPTTLDIADVPPAGSCVCKAPDLVAVHRTDGPCYFPDVA